MDDTHGAASAGRTTERPIPVRGRVLRLASAVVVLALVAIVAGFVIFALRLRTHEVPLAQRADGIVVLTGGASRVADGVELLSSGHGRRLLISGVHPTSTLDALARMMPEHRRLIECCVDLDRSARNTFGNAIEAANWVNRQGFASLIVVTSNYHMPRALLEFSHRMPRVMLYPYPVVGDAWRNEPWWSGGATARLVASEYVKFIGAWVRARLIESGLVPVWLRRAVMNHPPVVAGRDKIV